MLAMQSDAYCMMNAALVLHGGHGGFLETAQPFLQHKQCASFGWWTHHGLAGALATCYIEWL